jgi:DNA polymerase-3 subunit alpha
MTNLESALQTAEQHAEDHASGQQDLFGNNIVSQQPIIKEVADWSKQEKLQGEKEILGFYLSGHPLQRYQTELEQFISAPLGHINPNRNQSVTIAGWIIGLRTLFTKRGDRMAIVTLEDHTGRLDITIFSEVFNTHKDLLNKDRLLIVDGEVSLDEYTGNSKVLVKRALDITQARELYGRYLLLKIHSENISNDFIPRLQGILKSYRPGKCPIVMEYHRADSTSQLTLGADWQVQPSDALLETMSELLGEQNVQMVC